MYISALSSALLSVTYASASFLYAAPHGPSPPFSPIPVCSRRRVRAHAPGTAAFDKSSKAARGGGRLTTITLSHASCSALPSCRSSLSTPSPPGLPMILLQPRSKPAQAVLRRAPVKMILSPRAAMREAGEELPAERHRLGGGTRVESGGKVGAARVRTGGALLVALVVDGVREHSVRAL